MNNRCEMTSGGELASIQWTRRDPFAMLMIHAIGGIYNLWNLAHFKSGWFMDAQSYGASHAYGNYAYGVYMAASGASLSFTLSGANFYARFSANYSSRVPLMLNYPSLPVSNALNIVRGYLDEKQGSLCHLQADSK